MKKVKVYWICILASMLLAMTACSQKVEEKESQMSANIQEETQTESKEEMEAGAPEETQTENKEETEAQEKTRPEVSPEVWEKTTMEVVREMGYGINLGNTFEAFGSWVHGASPRDYYTCWGSPAITQKIIQGYADEGFGVLRIPVHWFNLMDNDYTINAAYLATVKQSVEWALDSGMYVIVNIHHDEDDMFANFAVDKEASMEAYTVIWTQLAEAFRDYEDHLILESLNEEGCWDQLWNRWGGDKGKAEAYALLNEINQTFVDIIRSSDRNNTWRHLLIAGYATDVDATCDPAFQMPDDPADHCAVSVHYYTPSTFAILEEDADWGKMRSTWGTEEDFEELYYYMDMLKTTFVDKGVPVIVGEYGCPKNNKDADSVRLYISSVSREAYERQMCPVLWDVTDLHYDRKACKMYDQELLDNFKSMLEE